MIQDQLDIAHIDINNCLDSLDVVKTPNGERVKDVTRYYHNVRDAYARNGAPDVGGYRKLWIGVGLDASIVAEMLEQMDNPAYRTMAASMFYDTVAEFNVHNSR